MSGLIDYQQRFLLALQAEPSLNVYRSSSFGAKYHALKTIYPKTYQLMGAAIFDALAHAYVTGEPSVSSDLSQYGHDFPQSISKILWRDMAMFEIAHHQVFYGPNNSLPDIQAIQAAITKHAEKIILLPPRGLRLIKAKALWQQDHQVKIITLKPSAFELLRLLQTEQPFYTISENYEQSCADQNLSEALQELFVQTCIQCGKVGLS